MVKSVLLATNLVLKVRWECSGHNGTKKVKSLNDLVIIDWVLGGEPKKKKKKKTSLDTNLTGIQDTALTWITTWGRFHEQFCALTLNFCEAF